MSAPLRSTHASNHPPTAAPRAALGWSLTAALMFIMVCTASPAYGSATATAASGGWFAKPADQVDYIWASQAHARAGVAAATITWTSGVNHADSASAASTFTENKFVAAQVGPLPATPVYHNLTGLSDTLVGNLGSTAITKGSGHSGVIPIATPNALFGFYYCQFTVEAGGMLGGPPQNFPWYYGRMRACDPWPLGPEDFDNISDQYDLYLPFEISEASLVPSAVGSDLATWSLSYETVDETIDVLTLSSDGASASLDIDPRVEIFLLDELSVLSCDPGDAISSADLLTLFMSDILPDMTLDTPIALGIQISALDKPTQELSAGIHAQVHACAEARSSASVPEPTTLVLLAAGGLMMCRRRR